MCGIYCVMNDNTGKAGQNILEGLKKLEYRGYDSWGIALIAQSENKIRVDKHIGKIGQAKTDLPDGTIGIGHTRWATHGGVTDINAHPHLDCNQKIAVIHNGIVENYQELKDGLIKKKHVFVSETDTEVIAHLIEEEKKHSPLQKAVFRVFKKLVGSNAIGVLDLKTRTIISCRNGSPLVVGIGKNSFYLASDVNAFLKFTNRVHFLKDGEGIVISQKGLKLFDISRETEKPLTQQTVDWKIEDAEKGGYPHFLLKEIMEQRKTIAKVASLNQEKIIEVIDKIKRGYKICMVACGSASYTTLAARYFFANAGIETESYGAYEFLPFAHLYGKKSIFLAISQSGETADTLIAAKRAKQNGAEIVAVVNARGSTLERLADHVLPVGAGPEIAVVSTKAFTSQLATLYLLSQVNEGKLKHGQKRIHGLELSLTSWLNADLEKRVVGLAKMLMDHQHAYLIGKHHNYPAALEFALKLKEASYTHAEAFAAGELKHGVIALIQKGTPCFVLAQNDDTKQEILSSAMELKARGGLIIGISPFEAKEFDYLIKTPDLGELTIIPNIIVGQLLGYYLGLGRGADPDKPRNLAKSVTVK